MPAAIFSANAESHQISVLQVNLQQALQGLQLLEVTDVFLTVELRSLPLRLRQPLPEWDTLRLSIIKGTYRAQKKLLHKALIKWYSRWMTTPSTNSRPTHSLTDLLQTMYEHGS